MCSSVVKLPSGVTATDQPKLQDTSTIAPAARNHKLRILQEKAPSAGQKAMTEYSALQSKLTEAALLSTKSKCFESFASLAVGVEGFWLTLHSEDLGDLDAYSNWNMELLVTVWAPRLDRFFKRRSLTFIVSGLEFEGVVWDAALVFMAAARAPNP